MTQLTKNEELILLSICKLKDNAYGVKIRNHISEITHKPLNYGSLCNTLYALVKKGYIQSRESEPVSLQGGRRKVIYHLTLEGKKVLKNAFEIHKQAWDGLTDMVFQGL